MNIQKFHGGKPPVYEKLWLLKTSKFLLHIIWRKQSATARLHINFILPSPVETKTEILDRVSKSINYTIHIFSRPIPVDFKFI